MFYSLRVEAACISETGEMQGTVKQTEKRGKGLHDLALSRDEERARTAPVAWIRLALPAPLIRRLMENRHLCIADVRCLDTVSKEQLHRSCLECCAKCLSHTALACSDLPGVRRPSTEAGTTPCCISSGSEAFPPGV